MTPRDQTLAQVVRTRADARGDDLAYTFLADGAKDARSITWSQLHRRAGARAAALSARGAACKPVLLMLPSGLEFVESLFACWYAGAIPVPVSLPRHHRAKHRLQNLIADAGARFAIGSVDVQQRLLVDDAVRAALVDVAWIDAETPDDLPDVNFNPHGNGRGIGLLQYTSGSTGVPRGVVVTHANLMCNSALIAEACGHGPDMNLGGWLPLFHDMGLIGLVAQSAYSGARLIFMAPERFLMRPWSWLQMISDYRICSSPAPNFGYDLCVDKVDDEKKRTLDLSCWRNALNGSEPVRPATLERFAAAFATCGFRSSAFFPCYGLAEATLFVTGPDANRSRIVRTVDGAAVVDGTGQGHVGCGRAYGDTRLAIVDPQARRRLPDGAVGEIWVAGSSCAIGYWNQPDATAVTFNARLEPASDDGTAWLRTGDLGMNVDGQLFITGRLRELIIIAGRNLFPVDLERTAEAAHAAIASSGVAAFSADIDNAERLIIVAEVRREYGARRQANRGDSLDILAISRQVRAAVAAEHEVAPHDVVLLQPGALPRTTSGKLNRGAARDAYLTNTMDRLEGRCHAHATV